MKNTFVVIDFETANRKHISACEIGMVKVKDGVISDRFYSLIQPPDNIYEKLNILIHGIRPEQTETASSFDMIWPKVKEFIADNYLVAHNINVDASILFTTASYYSVDVPDYTGVCTYEIFKRSLTDMCQAYGIERYYHNALIDAEACAKIYLNYLNQIQPDFSKITHKNKSSIFDFTGHEKICGDTLNPDFKNGDPSCLFYRKKVVITGIFNKIPRQTIAEILKELGADVDAGVTAHTNFIITGMDPGPSKIRKAETMAKDGYDIHLITENDFVSILEKTGYEF